MPKRSNVAVVPELNSWVLMRPPKSLAVGSASVRRCWKDSFPALVARVSPPRSGSSSSSSSSCIIPHDDVEITVLVPNVLVLRHAFGGSKYTVHKGLSPSDLRPCEAHKAPLTHALLTALKEASSVDAHVAVASRGVVSNSQEMAFRDTACPCRLPQLFELLPDFAGRLAEYLWSETATGETRFETVSAQDCFPLASTRYTTHSVPLREPMMFRFLRASSSLCSHAIAGILARQRIVCAGESNASFRLASIICGVTQAAFPSAWWGSGRRQRAVMKEASEEERQQVDEAAHTMLALHKVRRAAVRAKLAEESLASEEAELYEMWHMLNAVETNRTPGTSRLDEISLVVSKVFSRNYTIDPHLAALTLPELAEATAEELGVADEELGEALWVLHKRRKIFRFGDLVFPL